MNSNGKIPLQGRLPSAEEEARALRRMELRTVRTVFVQTFRSARFRLTLVVGLSVLLWFGLFRLLREGFEFLQTSVTQPIHDQIVHAIFNTFFFTLLVMLAFSSSIILYGSLFCSRETALLLTYPVRDERIFLHKFHQAVLLSSWGFLLLGSPMLLAYGLVNQAPWYYFAMLLPFMGAFVYIPVGVGAIVCLEIIHWLPRKRMHILAVAVAILVAAGAWFLWSIIGQSESDLLRPRWYLDMLARLELTEQRLLPSWWLSTGLLETTRHIWADSLLLLTLMVSNALFFRQMAAWTASRIYRRAYSAAAGAGSARKRVAGSAIDWLLGRLVVFFPTPVRLMLLKDLKLFLRDPVQWSQFVIFFGLLSLYFLNVRPLGATMNYGTWVSMVSFMNLSVVGLLMSTFTTRFIFPMISLEAKRFWLLGLLPLPRETIILSKFLFSVGCLFLPGCLLVLLSDVMLRVSSLIMVTHQLTCMTLCLGLSGIAVGLGARLPNLREQSPSRIAAGFGGTLNLVISTMYIVAVLLLMALPYHFYQSTLGSPGPGHFNAFARVMVWLPIWLKGGTALACLLGTIATVVPLWIGTRAFRRLEF